MPGKIVSVSAPDSYVVDTMVASMNPKPSCGKEVCPTDSYAKAVKKLAALDGSEKLDAADFEALGLRANLGKLADLIESDPYFQQSILAGKKSLVKGKSEIVSETKVPSVPPTYYKRLVYMMQVALRHLVDPSLPTTGYYGKKTAAAVAKFQGMVGIEGGQDGEIAGPRTLSALVMHCRMSKPEMIDSLKNIQSPGEEQNAFYYWDPARKEPSEFVKSSREAIIDAMVWLGLADLGLDPHTAPANDLVSEKVGYEQGMVTAGVIQKIIDMVTASDA